VNGVIAREAFLLGGEIIRLGQTALVVRRKAAHETASTPMRAFGRLVGESSQMRALYKVFLNLAQTRTPLAIHGERGTGKRLLAEELHAHGPFKDGPFVVVPRRAPIAPFFPLAQGGTLYIEDAAPEQASELVSAPTDVRIIVALRGPFEAAGLEHVTLPPLRERDGDVATLARHFWTLLGGEGSLPDDFVARVAEREWPGNCRELRMAVQDRLRHGAEETVSDIVEIASAAHSSSAAADPIADVVDRDLPFVPARHEILAEFERRYVDHALEKAGHNVARAAANSGIAHRYFQVLKSRRKNA
jgi:two-component system response regulator HydG